MPPETYKIALQKEFDLVYHGRFSYADVQSMPVGERDWHFFRLVETKTKEKEAHEKAVREAEASRSNSGGANRPLRPRPMR